jgi:sugar lactone lactonase YvrE
MRTLNRYPACIALLLLLAFVPSSSFAASHYVVTNDDVSGANTVTFYHVSGSPSSPVLTEKKVVPTGGKGHGGGYFAATGVALANDGQEECVYVADSDSNDIAGIIANTQQVSGKFKGSRSDSGGLLGITLAANNSYLYASFTGTFTLATFQIQPGCTLKFVRDIDVSGFAFGSVGPMAIHGNLLVVAYGDSTIESFDISNGVPVSNGDKQLSTGSKNGDLPSGVEITKDGHYALFGDVSGDATVEVSDISSGKLAPTVAYSLGTGNADSIRLSPDETLLYIANNEQGTVTAAFFDKVGGTLSVGCASGLLRGFNRNWVYEGNVKTVGNSGLGGALYVAEDGSKSGIAIVQVTSDGSSCTLQEAANSPVPDSNSQSLRAFAVYPGRPF